MSEVFVVLVCTAWLPAESELCSHVYYGLICGGQQESPPHLTFPYPSATQLALNAKAVLLPLSRLGREAVGTVSRGRQQLQGSPKILPPSRGTRVPKALST